VLGARGRRWPAWIAWFVDVGEVVLRGQVAWFRELVACGCDALAVDGGFAVASGVGSNTENGAVASPAIGPGELDRLVTWLRRRDLPASVIVTGRAEAGVVRGLTDRGLRAESGGNEMGRPLTGADGVEPPPGMVNEVIDRAALRDSYRVYAADGWFDGPGELDLQIGLADRLGFGRRVRHWVARHDGAAVGAATSFRFGDTIALVKCCVALPFRRRGIGTALTRARLAAAQRDGAVRAVVSPSPDGYQLHRFLGFELAPVPPDRWFYLE
jgi:GNAT superfamily N-acetyltransferase